MTSPALSWWLSGLIHLLILAAGTLLWQTSAQFGVQSGRSSVQVNLVAAAPTELTAESMPKAEAESTEPVEPMLQPPDLTADSVAPMPESKLAAAASPSSTTSVRPVAVPAPRPVLDKRISAERGDGSSVRPGKDATSMTSDGGAIVDTKPDYLRNPAAVYPEASRRANQEGLVVLQVIVDTKGLAETVTVRDSSGYELLDASALRAVRTWRFRPATLGGMTVRSRVLVPIRFRLDGR